MATKKVDDDGNIENTTGTEIQVLQSIEKAFYRNNTDTNRRNTARSMQWFSKYIPRSFNKMRTSQIMRDSNLHRNRITPGSMYFAVYDPIHKDTLPFWDEFPILLPWDTWRGKNGKTYMISINLHFLSPAMRLQAMQNLLKARNRKRYDRSTRMRISWEVLQAMSNSKMFEHCVRMYRLDHFRSKFILIPPASWEMAVFLPVARIKGPEAGRKWAV